jgi:hypothetical protein
VTDPEPFTVNLEAKPERITDPALADVLSQLIALEPIFHHPELGTARADFESMTVDDFEEIGASGRCYSRAEVLDLLEERYATPRNDVLEEVLEATDFYCRRLAPDLYLLVYTLLQDKARLTRRSTIWQSTPTGWKIVFHQGTIVQDTASAVS